MLKSERVWTRGEAEMKSLILTIRGVFAAFARVCGAIPASFLNFKGGGGGRKLAAP